jgi:hypothetical protein
VGRVRGNAGIVALQLPQDQSPAFYTPRHGLKTILIRIMIYTSCSF